jgi:hypothetical protein
MANGCIRSDPSATRSIMGGIASSRSFMPGVEDLVGCGVQLRPDRELTFSRRARTRALP